MTDKERENAFLALLDRQRDTIWSVCRAYSFSAAWETEDAFQEVLTVLWRDFETFNGRSSERTWVYRVTCTTLNMLKRKASNQPTASFDLSEVNSQPSDEVEYSYLLQMIESLDEPDSQIVMAHLHGFNQREIAQMTGLSIPTVARRMAKAKKWIKKQYTERFPSSQKDPSSHQSQDGETSDGL